MPKFCGYKHSSPFLKYLFYLLVCVVIYTHSYFPFFWREIELAFLLPIFGKKIRKVLFLPMESDFKARYIT